MLAAVGCDPRASNSPDVWQEGSAVAEAAFVDTGSSIDAGIVVAGRPGYLCLPLEPIGLAACDEVVRLETSCSCLRGRLVSYITAGDSLGQAMFPSVARWVYRHPREGSRDRSDPTMGTSPITQRAYRPLSFKIRQTFGCSDTPSFVLCRIH